MQIRTAKRYTCIYACNVYKERARESKREIFKEHRLKVEDGTTPSFRSQPATVLVSRFEESLCTTKLVEFTGLSTINKAGSSRCAGNCRASISSCKRSEIHVVRSKERNDGSIARRLPFRNHCVTASSLIFRKKRKKRWKADGIEEMEICSKRLELTFV